MSERASAFGRRALRARRRSAWARTAGWLVTGLAVLLVAGAARADGGSGGSSGSGGSGGGGGGGTTPTTGATFQPLGLGPSGVQSFAWDVSADGSVVVGTFWVSDGFFIPTHAFRWQNGVFQDLGYLNPAAHEAQAYGVSDDGTEVVGWARGLSGYQRPFLWTAATGMQELSNVPGTDAIAEDISRDGSVVVGYYVGSDGFDHGFRWSAGQVTDLGFLPGGRDTKGMAVGAAGAVVVGSTLDSNQVQRAFRWQQSMGLQDIGALRSTSLAYAEGCSEDGTVVVGTSSDDKGNILATRWDPSGIRSLGTLGGSSSESHAVSADGAIVVGGAGLPFVNGISDFSAFRWDSASGKIQQLSRILASGGVTNVQFSHQLPAAPGTWFVELALGISSDGRTIVGCAQDPTGALQAFRAVVPR